EAENATPGVTGPPNRYVPSDHAIGQLALALQGMAKIEALAKAAEATQLQRMDNKSKPFDHLRYLMIFALSNIFTRMFDLPPTTTYGGPWCTFLREVLERCERKRLSDRGAYDIWRKARKWNESLSKNLPEVLLDALPKEDGLYRIKDRK